MNECGPHTIGEAMVLRVQAELDESQPLTTEGFRMIQEEIQRACERARASNPNVPLSQEQRVAINLVLEYRRTKAVDTVA